MISYFTESIELPVFDKFVISNWLTKAAGAEKLMVGDLNYIFCSDDYLLKMNIDYLNHDYYTDVITFDYTEYNVISGDVFISVDRVAENAKIFSKTFHKELFRVMIHGLLHLMGYSDKDDLQKGEMTNQEDKFLELLNIK